MKKVDTQKLSPDECWGIQINGILHCQKINCKWQGLTACQGKSILINGVNSKGYKIGETGLVEHALK
ncbi:MAG: hypothetical protein K9H49_01550 [Bacteroidales bacterium]|nr:hypothetical protein [Bacteroidales bacterium]MCF8404609.1 hypothetical protein [Bacteroidales bacterium]